MLLLLPNRSISDPLRVEQIVSDRVNLPKSTTPVSASLSAARIFATYVKPSVNLKLYRWVTR
jgi:hypothetical protein